MLTTNSKSQFPNQDPPTQFRDCRLDQFQFHSLPRNNDRHVSADWLSPSPAKQRTGTPACGQMLNCFTIRHQQITPRRPGHRTGAMQSILFSQPAAIYSTISANAGANGNDPSQRQHQEAWLPSARQPWHLQPKLPLPLWKNLHSDSLPCIP